MTPAQDKKYWRRWAACARANQWKLIGGRLHPDARLAGSEPHCSVHAAALQLAAMAARGLAPDHLRHACHQVALGHDKSHTQFSNREFDALLNYWGDERGIRGRLIEPLDLAAVIHGDNPVLKQRERWLLGIRRDFLGGYVADLADRMFGTKDWEQLEDADLSALHHILQDRPNGRKAGSSQRNDPTSEDPDWSIA